jgi:hypothetical protein
MTEKSKDAHESYMEQREVQKETGVAGTDDERNEDAAERGARERREAKDDDSTKRR